MELLQERQLMLKNGVLEVIVTLDTQKQRLIRKVQIISRGSFYVGKEIQFNEQIINQLTDIVNNFLTSNFNEKMLITKIKEKTSQLVYEKKKISPLIDAQILVKKH